MPVTLPAPRATLPDQLRKLAPLGSVLLLLVASFTPLPFMTNLRLVAPPLALLGSFYWSVQRPDRFGILSAFCVGLLQDLLSGAPPGVSAFLFALLQRLALRQHYTLKGMPYLLLWSLYGATQVVVALLQWLLWSWLAPTITNAAHMLPLGPFLLQALFGIVLYPLVVWLLGCLRSTQKAAA